VYPEPREFASAAEVRANIKDVRERLRSLPAWQRPEPPQAPPPPPSTVPEPITAIAPGTIAEQDTAADWEDIAPAPHPPKPGFSRAPLIIAMVAAHYGLTRAEITSANRTPMYLMPRYIAMYLCIRYLGMSSRAVGRLFGRDHSTVLSALRKCRARLADDEKYAADVAEFVRQIESWS
jgi:hypothetical protein